MRQKLRSFIQDKLRFIKKYPLRTILVSLGLVLILIVIVNLTSSTNDTPIEAGENTITTWLYTVGEAPTYTATARIEIAQYATIVAQNSGIVQSIHTLVGSNISQGTPIITLTTSYSGTSIPGVQAQIAQRQYLATKENYPLQLEQIELNEEIIKESDKNSEELRRINRDSLRDTRNQLNLSESILQSIEQNLSALESADTPNPDLILSAQQLKNQMLSSVNSLRQAVRNLELQTDSSAPPSNLIELERQISESQLELRRRSLDIELEISRLQRDIANISLALMNPVSPFRGRVEQVMVRLGQSVNPGTPIAIVSGDGSGHKAVSYVPTRIADHLIPGLIASTISQDQSYEYTISHISSQPVSQGLHIVELMPLSETTPAQEGEVITLTFKVGLPDTGSTLPFIPIDAVHQTTTGSFVFVNQDGKASSKKVVTSNIIGSLIQIESGIDHNDQIVLNRSVVSGDRIIIN